MGSAMNGSPVGFQNRTRPSPQARPALPRTRYVGFQNRTLTEPAGETYFVRPFLTWFALGALVVA